MLSRPKVMQMMTAIFLCCFVATLRAADQGAAASDDARAKELSTQLASADQENVDHAVAEIHTLLESDPDGSTAFCRKYWLPSLLSASQSAIAESLALDAILAAPWQTGNVEFFQEARVRISLGTHQPADALSKARSLFNVASLRGTEHALTVVAECLIAVHGEDNAMLRRFGKEQLAGATTRPITQIQPTSVMLAEIPIDPSPYATLISQFVSDDDQSRKAKGNLLLLAGRCDEAKSTFDAMLRLSDTGDHIGLAENVARAIKASDGTIGRANGYMLSLAEAQKAQ